MKFFLEKLKKNIKDIYYNKYISTNIYIKQKKYTKYYQKTD